jgi:hypothetical protein
MGVLRFDGDLARWIRGPERTQLVVLCLGNDTAVRVRINWKRLMAALLLTATSVLVVTDDLPIWGNARSTPVPATVSLGAPGGMTASRDPNLDAPRSGPIVQQIRRGGEVELPLGILVSGNPEGAAVEVRGLPPRAILSAGYPLGTDGWRILASELADAKVRPPPDFTGTIELSVELRLSDKTVADRQSVVLEWPRSGPDGTLSAPVNTVSMPAAMTPTPMPSDADNRADLIAISGKLNAQKIDLLLQCGLELFSAGEVAAARVPLERAAKAHDARAAFVLAATYDSIVLERFNFHDPAANATMALTWYARAKEFALSSVQPDGLLELPVQASSVAAKDVGFPLDAGVAERLLKRGQEFMQYGQVAEARTIFQRVAALGDPRGAREIAESYKPSALQRAHARGISSDLLMALVWYRKADELGLIDAQRRSAQLAAGRD